MIKSRHSSPRKDTERCMQGTRAVLLISRAVVLAHSINITYVRPNLPGREAHIGTFLVICVGLTAN